jgi:hypothetical protein
METFKIKTLTESDIDNVIKEAGGSKIDTREREKLSIKTADYLFGNSLIELKLVNEEGLNKQERRNKLSALFNKKQKNRPVVILLPHFLDKEDLNKYYNILETPIKTHIKKASTQLMVTEETLYPNHVKILLIINNGYTSLGMNEFEKICVSRVKNDTSNIDFVIVAGIYFYSDDFDLYSFFPFQLIKITNKSFNDFDKLLDSWNNYSELIMTKMIREPNSIDFNRLPSYDISYQHNGKYFVSPSPPIQRQSKFYIHGRPRHNSTNIEVCPQVANTFPFLNKEEWTKAKFDLIDNYELSESYEDYYRLYNKKLLTKQDIMQPFVPIEILYDSFVEWCKNYNFQNDFYSLCEYANGVFDRKVKEIIFSARNIDETKIFTTNHVYLLTEEIGRDKAFDISSAYIIRQTLYQKTKTLIFKDLSIFHEYGLSLASCYAFKNNIHSVYYKIDKTFGWY